MIGIFAPQYFGSVQYYAAMARCSHAVVDLGLRYDKRFKSTHRCEIVDTQGRLTLTVPVTKPDRGNDLVSLWRHVNVSPHGLWWQDHRVSLESAYGRTPFFEFYIDRFLPFLQYIDQPITDLDRAIDTVLRRALNIDTPVDYVEDYELRITNYERFVDFRNNDFTGIDVGPYYQVRADKLGFVPNLSALDLLFNLGPESILAIIK